MNRIRFPTCCAAPSTRAPWRLLALAVLLAPIAASGHGASAGDIEITHPFATPTLPGATVGAAYIATLSNNGARPDKLVRAATPAAAAVEIHTMSVDAQGVMRMREVGALDLAARETVKMRPGMGVHLMLVGLKVPLKAGDTFPMTLQFDRAGPVEVKVVVQTPRSGDGPAHKH